MSKINIVGLDFGDDDTPISSEVQTFKKFLDPGLHEVTITGAAIYETPAEKQSQVDSNWCAVKIEVTKEGYSPSSFFVEFPLNKEGLEGYTTSFGNQTPKTLALRKLAQLTKLIESLGMAPEGVTKKSLGKLLQQCFADPAKLIGLHLVVDVTHKWQHAYSRYIAKNTYHLIDPEGNVVKEDDSPKVFGDYKDAEAYAKLQNWKFSGFANVSNFRASATPNDFKKLAGTKPVVVAGMNDEDL